jgi:hypothetical protein
MSNPFNKLKVHRDDEDIEQPVQQKTVTNSALASKDDKKPKKKVRPEEKKEEQVKEIKEEVNDVGFEVVGKQKKQKNYDDTEQVLEKPGKKDAPRNYHHKRSEQNFRQGTGQRVFDRHVSGTGRGKEVKKEGRGGKYTWDGKGREIVERDDADYIFTKVLNNTNTKAEPVQYEENYNYNNYDNYGNYGKYDKYSKYDNYDRTQKYEKTEKTEKQEEVKVEEKQEVPAETTPADGDKDKDKKKKLKKGEVNPEEDEKNKLVIPENAMTLKDYKEKSAKITTNTTKTAPIKVDLEVLAKDADEHVISIPTTKGGKKDKKKEKGVNKEEVDLNKLIGSSIGFEDSNDRQGKKTYQKNYGKNY